MDKTGRKHWTWDDYVGLPEDGKRYEVLDGELVEMRAPSTGHQYALIELVSLLRTWAKTRSGGLVFCAPLDVHLAYDIVVQPDVMWIAPGSRHIVEPHAVTAIPDLVIEVLSPSNPGHDTVRKREIYARYRTFEYWIVDPRAKTVSIYRLKGRDLVPHASGRGKDRLRSSLSRGLVVVPGTLFLEPAPVKGPGPRSPRRAPLRRAPRR